MATIAKMIVEAEVDPSGVSKGLNRMQALINSWASKQSQLAKSRQFNPLGDIGSSKAARVAQRMVANLNTQFSQAQNNLKFDVAAGKINLSQFNKLGKVAAKEFNDALLASIGNLRASGVKIPSKVLDAMIDQFKSAGFKAGDEFSTAFRAKALGDKLSSAGGALTVGLTLPIAAAGVAMIGVAKDFQSGMNRVRAVTDATTQEFQALYKEARRLGATTEFTPQDIATGMSVLAQSGQDANLVLKNIGPTVAIASANLIDMGTAADVTTSIMLSYNLSAAQMTKATDQLTYAALHGKANIVDLGVAFRYTGSIAERAGLAFSETTAALVILGRAGLKGSLGGTSLRGAITKLLNPSDEATGKLRKMGLQIFDSTGKMLPLVAIIKQLEDKGISAGQIMDLFGQRAGPGLAALMNAGSKGVAELTAELESQAGTAARIRKVQLEGLRGGLFLLRSAFEDLAVAISGSGLLDLLDRFVRRAANIISGLTQLNPIIYQAGIVIAVLAAAIGPLLFVGGKLLVLFAQMTLAVQVLKSEAALGGLATLLGAGGAVVIGMAILTGVLYLIARRAREAGEEITQFKNAIVLLNEAEQRTTADNLRKRLDALEKEKAALQAKVPKQSAATAVAVAHGGSAIASPVSARLAEIATESKKLQTELNFVNHELGENARRATQDADALAKMRQNMQDVIDLMNSGTSGATANDPLKWLHDLQKIVGDLTTRSELLGSHRDLLTGENKILTGLVEQYNLINGIIAKQGGYLTANVELLQLQADLAEQIAKQNFKLSPAGSRTVNPVRTAGASASKLTAEQYDRAAFKQAIYESIEDIKKLSQTLRVSWHNIKEQFSPSSFFATTLPQLKNTFGKVGVEIAEQFTPVGIASTFLAGAMEGLQPVLDALKEPLRLLGEIVGRALAPILKALFPVIKSAAISLTYLAQVVFTVAGAIAVAIGSVVEALAKFINKIIPFGDPLKGLENSGRDLKNLGKGFLEAADEMKKGREELRALEWEDALAKMTDAANAASEALLNIPQGYKLLELRRFEATLPLGVDTPPVPGAGAGSGGHVPEQAGPGEQEDAYRINIESLTVVSNDPEQLFDDIQEVGERRSRARHGTTRKWSSI